MDVVLNRPPLKPSHRQFSFPQLWEKWALHEILHTRGNNISYQRINKLIVRHWLIPPTIDGSPQTIGNFNNVKSPVPINLDLMPNCRFDESTIVNWKNQKFLPCTVFLVMPKPQRYGKAITFCHSGKLSPTAAHPRPRNVIHNSARERCVLAA